MAFQFPIGRECDHLLEDISNLLNVGEIPQLFTNEEFEEIVFEMQKTISKKKLIGAAGSETYLRE